MASKPSPSLRPDQAALVPKPPHAVPAPASLDAARQAIQAQIPDALLTTSDAAAYVALKPATLIDYRTRHVGPPWLKLGGACRYLRSDLDAWIQSCRKGA